MSPLENGKGRTVAVIGSNSFSGSHFVRACLCAGLSVVGISRSPEPHPAFLPFRWGAGQDGNPSGSYVFHQADLNDGADTVAEIIEGYRAPLVVNFAAQGMVAPSWEAPLDWYRTNLLGVAALTDRLRGFRFLERYVHVSTPEVYGSTGGTIAEDAPFNPSTPYAVSRAACEFHLRAYFRRYAFPVVFTRAANVYGPGQQLYRIVPRTMLFIRMGRKLPLHGGGRSVRSFIHIRDAMDATLRLALEGVPGEAYHISTRESLSIRELVERICVMMGADFDAAAETVGDRPGKDEAYLLDSGKLRGETGWTDRISLEEGLRDTLAWVDGNLDFLRGSPLDYVHKK